MRVRICSFLAVLALVMGACTSSSPTADPSGSPTASPSPTATPTPPPAPVLAPLTGIRVTSAGILGRAALAIKIDNHVDARPQVGILNADVVYEEPVEGGITRFIAIFHSRDASKVGPVRSARLTDLDVLREYGRPLLAFSGAADYVIRAIKHGNHLVALPAGAFGSSIFRRDSSRWIAPHNLFTSTSALWRIARKRHTSPAPALWNFGALLQPPPAPLPTTTPGGTATPVVTHWDRGVRVTIPFGGSYTAQWRWDGRLKRYLRFVGGRPHRVSTGSYINAANVLVMRVGLIKRSKAAALHGTPELGLVGSGEAVLLRDGVRIVGRWSRPSIKVPTVFIDRAGREFVFAPGNTWVELVPTKIKPRY